MPLRGPPGVSKHQSRRVMLPRLLLVPPLRRLVKLVRPHFHLFQRPVVRDVDPAKIPARGRQALHLELTSPRQEVHAGESLFRTLARDDRAVILEHEGLNSYDYACQCRGVREVCKGDANNRGHSRYDIPFAIVNVVSVPYRVHVVPAAVYGRVEDVAGLEHPSLAGVDRPPLGRDFALHHEPVERDLEQVARGDLIKTDAKVVQQEVWSVLLVRCPFELGGYVVEDVLVPVVEVGYPVACGELAPLPPLGGGHALDEILGHLGVRVQRRRRRRRGRLLGRLPHGRGIDLEASDVGYLDLNLKYRRSCPSFTRGTTTKRWRRKGAHGRCCEQAQSKEPQPSNHRRHVPRASEIGPSGTANDSLLFLPVGLACRVCPPWSECRRSPSGSGAWRPL
ncbi:hypothetical protein THAOC_13521 [Thalassiosira oceanica]|uniref:Uncharacterized protein n=1 Tax=Thalassiosira oceanica TaxID=159749 RepID=K0T5D2_THAOC|nr:hypothetical protein THAOC_13521 [Thalassiosira oceanica]|eukprot:EJK65597.1 hypothetical protein THAOC_13521 [Thalassiosira oceanica]